MSSFIKYKPYIKIRIVSLAGTCGSGTFLCSTHLSMKFIMIINVKMPTIVGILIFMSMINITSKHLKARRVLLLRHFKFYEHLKFHAQLS